MVGKRLYIAEILDGLPLINILSPEPQMYSELCNLTSKLNIEVDLNLADAVLIPHDIYYLRNNPKYLEYIKEISKSRPVLIFNLGDWPLNLGHKNLIYFQTYINFNVRKRKIIQVPYNIELFGGLKNLPFGDPAKYSFIGFIPRFGPRRVLKGLKTMPFSPIKSNSFFVRNLMINKIRRLDNTQIIKRAKFGAAKGFSNKELSENRRQYVDSIEKHEFIWCPRGDANQSMRFYETLSAGRIALVPNSNMGYPFYLCDRHRIFIVEVKWFTNWRDFLELYTQKLDLNDWQNLVREMRKIYESILHYPRFMESVLREFTTNTQNENLEAGCSIQGGPCRIAYKL